MNAAGQDRAKWFRLKPSGAEPSEIAIGKAFQIDPNNRELRTQAGMTNPVHAMPTEENRNDPALERLLAEVRACRHCASILPHGPRPIVQVGTEARLLIVGQAPGARVHVSGIPWDDASGQRLRDWLQIDSETFYDPRRIAIIPMGYCYPGKGTSGDLPPRHECAELWHDRLLAKLPHVELTLLIGQYAQRHFLGAGAAGGVGATVADYARFAPRYLPLPHPSPRNVAWFRRNPWFEAALLPSLRSRVCRLLGTRAGKAR